ncbi:hypothetical protein DRJ22_03910 [Candidatus Woesearchaeota archaeon]|nr:MAG: hypothetical protein DRJ22_03910 [Candidatus Woesearchaeota archaeon]
MEHQLLTQKKEIINLLLKQNIIVNAKILQELNNQETIQKWHTELRKGTRFEDLIIKKETENNQASNSEQTNDIEILFDYDKPNTKKTIQDFIDYFSKRYKQLSKLLQTRAELQNLTSIARIQGKQDRETISIIAYVADKQTTKNENIILTLEDETGRIKALIGKTKEETYKQAKDLAVDEVIGIKGTTGNNIIFADTIIYPDIPVQTELKKAPEEVNVAILSDLHYGSKLFLEEEFKKFIAWTQGKQGTKEQRDLAQKTKYIIIAGDLVDGVGVYPNQEEELKIKDITKQYEQIAQYLSLIPKDKTIIIIPGNHDATRLSEPQPKLNKKFAKPIYELPNTINLSNPARIKINVKNVGFEFLIYHGYSYTYYGDKVESIRTSGKDLSARADLIMKFLLQRRHLAPSHSSTLYLPDKEKDTLVIEKVPDFFISGHMHKPTISNYRGVSLISGSCWQSTTTFMEKMGIEADPAKVLIINLQTRNITIMNFSQND